MDAIGLTLGLANANFNADSGYTIISKQIKYYTKTASEAIIGSNLIETIDCGKPIKGVMGWFGNGYDGSQSTSASNAVRNYGIALTFEPAFILPYSYGVMYAVSADSGIKATSGSQNGCFACDYSDSSSNLSLHTYVSHAQYWVIFCFYLYIFF